MEAPEGQPSLGGPGNGAASSACARCFCSHGRVAGLSWRGAGGDPDRLCAPTAISSYVMAQNMGSDDELAGQLVLTTTLFQASLFFVGYSAARYAVNLICNYLKFES